MYGNVACPGHATQFIIDDLHQRKLVCTHEVRSEWALRGNGLEFVSDGVKEVFATKSFFSSLLFCLIEIMVLEI